MRKRFYILVINTYILLFLFNCMNAQSSDSIYYDLFHYLEGEWNEEGFWGKAKENLDNSYNEAISYYLFMDKAYNLNSFNKISKSINYSFKFLRAPSSGFYQNGKKGKASFMRSAMYLNALAKVYEFYKIDINRYKNEIETALKWMNEYKRPYTGNQGIVAMHTYKLWSELLKSDEIELYYNNMRKWVISDFINVNDSVGFWPEGPRDWKINVPYAQLQSIFLGQYLLDYKDPVLLKLYEKQLNSFYYYYSYNPLKLNVTESSGPYKKKGIKALHVSTASVFYLREYLLNNKVLKNNKLFNECYKNFLKKKIDYPTNLFTDGYCRFGIIKEIEEKYSK